MVNRQGPFGIAPFDGFRRGGFFFLALLPSLWYSECILKEFLPLQSRLPPPTPLLTTDNGTVGGCAEFRQFST